MSKKKKIFIGLGFGLVIVFVVLFNMNGKNQKAVEVQTEKVKRSNVIKTVSASGKIQPVTDIKISSNVSARITKLMIKEGDKVKKGQLLVSLDRTNYEAAVNQAKADVLRAKAQLMTAKTNLQKAQQDYDRMKGLYDKQLASLSEFQNIEAALSTNQSSVESAQSQVLAAEAGLDQTKDNLYKTEIYSPIDGTVSKLNKEVGEIALGSAFSQDIIMTIANLTNMEARVNVDENDVVAISIGDSALIEVDALPNDKLRGFVTEIANSANVKGLGTQEEKTEFEVKIALDQTVFTLRPGMSTTSDVTTDVRNNVLNVPIQCVTVREPDKLKRKAGIEKDAAIADDTSNEFVANRDGVVEIVFVVENGIVIAKPVKTGIQSESSIEILEGLKENDEVVTGNYRAISKLLENGSSVTVNNSIKSKKNMKETEHE
jgi:HlyD family secretion protein